MEDLFSTHVRYTKKVEIGLVDAEIIVSLTKDNEVETMKIFYDDGRAEEVEDDGELSNFIFETLLAYGVLD